MRHSSAAQIVTKDNRPLSRENDQERLGLTFWNFCHPGVDAHASDVVYDLSTDSFFQWTGKKGRATCGLSQA